MKAMIFAAGLGTRLRPLTDSCPKALMPLGNTVMLGYVLRRLIASGVNHAVVNVHHHPDMIAEYLERNDNFGIHIDISDERDSLLDTGGGLLHARRFLDDGSDMPIILHNADIYTDVDLRQMAYFHCGSGALGTLLVAERNSSRKLLFDSGMRMCGWQNVSTGEIRPTGCDVSRLKGYAFGGVHIVSPAVFPLLERFALAGSKFSITDFYIAACAHTDLLGYMPPEAYDWVDIGSPEKLEKARQLYNDKNS